MTTLHVINEGSSKQLGAITRADDGSFQTTGIGGLIFEQIRDGKGWDEQQTFEALVEGGWSNGYVTVRTPE